jgi:VWFA-related protein
MMNLWIRSWPLRIVVLLALGAPVFAADTIQLEVRVSGKDGSPTDLSTADFQVKENGKEQDIAVAFVGGAPETGQPKLWLYIAVDVTPPNYPRAEQAIRKYLDEMHQPAVFVSLGGSPFSNNAAELKALLSPSLSPQGAEIAGQQIPGLLPFWKVGTDALLSGRPMLDSYTVLTRQLGMLPGKKVVVLFREGLRLDRDGLDTGNAPSAELGTGGRGNDRLRSTLGSNDAAPMQFVRSFDRLASEALRNRVAFYPVHPEAEALGGVGSQGLNQLANRTGGRPLLTQGDPSAIFTQVLDDTSGYYLITYEPSDERQRGRKRRINVRVNRKGFRADSLGEYMERSPGEQPAPQRAAAPGPAALTADDAAMKAVLGQVGRTDFPLDASHAVFRGPDGQAILLYALGVHPSGLTTSEARGALEADFSIAAQALAGENEAAYASVREKRAFPAKAFRDAAKDPRMRTTHTGELRGLAPGSYQLRLAWKDESGDKASTAEIAVTVPDFSQPLAASSLFITRDAAQGASPANDPLGDLLTVGDTHFVPDPSTKFSAGETLFIVYHLYNVPEEVLRQPPGVQFVVLQNDRPVANAPAGGDAIVVKQSKQIRYRVMLQTDQLTAGTYQVMVGVPQANSPRPRVLTKEFVIQ